MSDRLPRPQRKLVPAHKAQPVEGVMVEEPIINTDRLRPSDRFYFEPRPDITTAELAEMVAALDIQVHFERFLKLSENLQRHFRHRKL